VSNVELLIEGGATTFVAGLGVPSHVVELCHQHQVLVISMCGKVEHAKRALDAGCDVVVAQGTEAGGHTGTVATLPLVPLIVDAVMALFPSSPRAASLTDAVWPPRSRSAPTVSGLEHVSLRRPKHAPARF
jgi:NAD(P)H-dependent flavin oxidoreductase YrpB (nitropropane dioxygenase family)